MEILDATAANIRRAAEALKAGEVIAYPTETVYGLGVDPLNEAALNRLYAIKQRDPNHPVLLIAANREQVSALVAGMSDAAEKLANAFWPGPLSMLLLPRAEVSKSLLGPAGKICVRVTSHPIAAALCKAFGRPIVSTSANLSGQPPARKAQDVPAGIGLCLDGGPSGAGAASSVIDPDTGEIQREGAISRTAIELVSRVS